jgi:hypothetical protein
MQEKTKLKTKIIIQYLIVIVLCALIVLTGIMIMQDENAIYNFYSWLFRKLFMILQI